jgi:hypothetical protein
MPGQKARYFAHRPYIRIGPIYADMTYSKVASVRSTEGAAGLNSYAMSWLFLRSSCQRFWQLCFSRGSYTRPILERLSRSRGLLYWPPQLAASSVPFTNPPEEKTSAAGNPAE